MRWWTRWDFDHAALVFEFLLPPAELVEDAVDGGLLALGLHDVVAFGVDGEARVLLLHGAEERIDLRERVDFVAEELDAVGVLVVGGIDLDDVAANAEGAAAEVGIVALVEDFDEAAGDVFAADALAFFEQQQHAVVGFRRAEAVDAGHGGDDDGVAALEERAGSGKAELVQLLVDGGFFLDVEVAGGNVGFRLVIVVIRHKILDRVVGEELLELVEELGGEGFVMGEDESGAVEVLDHLGHGEGFAGAGDAEQDLMLLAGLDAGEEFLDGAALIATRLVIAD